MQEKPQSTIEEFIGTLPSSPKRIADSKWFAQADIRRDTIRFIDSESGEEWETSITAVIDLIKAIDDTKWNLPLGVFGKGV